METRRLPPHDTEAEEAVIGSLLVDGELIKDTAHDLRPEDFFSQVNGWIYEACLRVYQRNEGINEVTVAHQLSRDQRLEGIGGVAHLAYLVSRVPDPYLVRHYADIVIRLSHRRQLISEAAKMARAAYDMSGPEAADVLESAINRLTFLRATWTVGPKLPRGGALL